MGCYQIVIGIDNAPYQLKLLFGGIIIPKLHLKLKIACDIYAQLRCLI